MNRSRRDVYAAIITGATLEELATWFDLTKTDPPLISVGTAIICYIVIYGYGALYDRYRITRR